MPVYIDTTGNSVLSVAVCDRCNRKFAYVDLMPDPNFPGMRVCKDDLDNFDPWRLPARQTENISLRFPRPDVSIALTASLVNTTDGDGNNAIFIEGVPPVGGAQGDLSQNNNQPYSQTTLNPVIGSVQATSGPASGGYIVNIFGGNFTDIATVKFGTTSASFSLVSSTQIMAIAPAHIAGTVNVAVIGPFGTGTAINAFTYI